MKVITKVIDSILGTFDDFLSEWERYRKIRGGKWYLCRIFFVDEYCFFWSKKPFGHVIKEVDYGKRI